jgi:ankyrin repeat protein
MFFTGLMKSWNPSLGSLEPQFKNDMKSFQTAIINGNKDEVERLINKYQKTHDAYGNEMKSYDIVNYEFKERSNDDGSPLYLAVSRKYKPEIVQLLIENGANVNWKGNYYGISVLTNACILTNMIKKNTNIPRLLIENGADVNILDKYDRSPIVYVCRENIPTYYDLVKLLLDNGANVNDIEKYNNDNKTSNKNDDNTLLILECSKKGSDINIDVINLLLEKGANINAKNKAGKTAYDLAGSDEVRQAILAHFEKDLLNGVNPDASVISKLSPEEQKARQQIISKSRALSLNRLLGRNNIYLSHETNEMLTQSLLHEGMGGGLGKNKNKNKKTKMKRTKMKRTKKHRVTKKRRNHK